MGLLNPATILFEEVGEELIPVTPPINLGQQKLWGYLLEDVGRLLDLVGDDEMNLLHVGDVTQGTFRPKELVSTKAHDQVMIAAANFEPFLRISNLKRIRLCKGTDVHVGGEGSSELSVAALLRAAGHDASAVYHWKIDAGGVVFDVSHHGPGPGSRHWLKGNVLRLYTQSLMDDILADGDTPPNVLLRGHFHTLTSEIVTRRARGKTFRTWAALLPSYTWPDDFARKKTQSKGSTTIGMLAVETIGNRVVEIHEFVRSIDFRTSEVWSP